MGFTIAPGVLGGGCVIPHYGTIVVGTGNTIGYYAVLHTSICITAGRKIIGDGLYCSTGAKILNDIELGDGVTIGANAVVNKSFCDSKIMLAGCPSNIIKKCDSWYKRDGKEYYRRYRECQILYEKTFNERAFCYESDKK